MEDNFTTVRSQKKICSDFDKSITSTEYHVSSLKPEFRNRMKQCLVLGQHEEISDDGGHGGGGAMNFTCDRFLRVCLIFYDTDMRAC